MSYEDFLNRLSPKAAKNSLVAKDVHMELYPTASLGINRALGGGFGGGRFVLLYGNYSSGKTMMVLQTIGVLQKLGKTCGFIDVEGTFSPSYAESLGVDTSQLIIAQVRLASQIEEVAVAWIEAKIDFVGIDSLSMMMADVFIDKKTGEMKGFEDRGQIGADARGIKRLLKGLAYALTGTDTCVTLISQTTTEIGQTYVKQIAEGGKAPGFFSSVSIQLASSENIKEQILADERVGNVILQKPIGRHVTAKVIKNKLNGQQSQEVKYDIYYGGPKVGIDNVGEIVDQAIEQEVLVKAGAWIKFPAQDKSFNGRPALIKAVKEDDELFEIIKAEVDKAFNGDSEE